MASDALGGKIPEFGKKKDSGWWRIADRPVAIRSGLRFAQLSWRS